MFEIKEKKMLNEKITELEMNLENNYKDLAHDALRELYALLEYLHNNKKIKDKTYEKFKKTADEHKKDMEGYGHFTASDADIFLKEK
jgi:hypothetical protein